MNELKIEKLPAGAHVPFNLLLLADETVGAIEKYIYASDIYIVKRENEDIPVAVFVLQHLNSSEIELKNIAVAAHLQGKGTGSYLINEIKKIAVLAGFKILWVGTPDVAVKEINFYQKNGFELAGVKKEFFIINYPDPIFDDNATMLRHMAMLKYNLG